MELVDICFNFTHKDFRKDEDQVLQRAVNVGVNTMILAGASLNESEDAVNLALQYPSHCYCAAGTHPHNAKEWKDDDKERLLALCKKTIVRAVGECGLDYYHDLSPRDKQRLVFEKQIQIAEETSMPLLLHQREAHKDFLSILDLYKGRINHAVVHCFTGDKSQLFNYLDRGFYIGITGWICDETRGRHLHDLVSLIPSDRLMIETDAPYLIPHDLEPTPENNRNEPAYLPHILKTIARNRNESDAELAAQTTATAKKFFSIL